MDRRKYYLLWALPLALPVFTGGCMKGPGFMTQGKGELRNLVTASDPTPPPSAASTAPISTPAAVSAEAGMIAVGTEMADELSVALIAAGLSAEQTQVIVNGSRDEVAVAAGNIAISVGLHLVEVNPITYAAGPVVRGAIKRLDDPAAGLLDPELRAAIAKIIMSSTFTSLGKRTADMSKDAKLALQKNMVGGAVLSMNEGGLGGDGSASSLKAITGGAMAALQQSGLVDEDTVEGATGIIAGAVESLNDANLPQDDLKNMMGSATAGVVGGLSDAGVADAAGAASKVAETAISSLRSLNLPAAKIFKAAEGAASGAVAGLTKAGVAASAVADAARQVASASVTGLGKVGLPEDSLGQGAGSIASGAIQGSTMRRHDVRATHPDKVDRLDPRGRGWQPIDDRHERGKNRQRHGRRRQRRRRSLRPARL